MSDKEDIIQFQQLQQQLQVLIMQKQNVQTQLVELDNALAELDKNKEEYVFEVIGNIMIKKSSAEVKSALKEKKDLVNLRISTIDKQVEKINEKAADLQKKMSERLKEKK